MSAGITPFANAAQQGEASIPLSVIVSPASIFGFGISCPTTTGAATATPSGGAGGYLYAWDFTVGGSGMVINSPTSSSTTVTRNGAGASTGTMRCTVTDDDLDTAEDDCAVDTECGT